MATTGTVPARAKLAPESEPQQFDAMCLGKEQYPSFNAADFVATDLRKDKKVPHRHKIHAYECKFGNHFHVGH